MTDQQDQQLTLEYQGKTFHTGYSRIEKFLACPAQYKFTYIDGHRFESSGPMKRGTVYHGVLETALAFKIKQGRSMSLKACIDLTQYHAEQEELPEIVTRQTMTAVEYWHAMVYQSIDPLFVEKPFEIIKAGVKITGRVDLGTVSGVCVDHKFSYDLWADARAKKSVQPAIYQWAWEDQFAHEYRVPYKAFEYHVIRTHPHVAAQNIRCYKMNEEASAWYENQILTIAQAMCAGIFFAQPDVAVCGRCFHRKRCNPVFYRLKSRVLGENADYDPSDM